MKSKIPPKAESHVNRSNTTNGVCGFSRPRQQKFLCTTAMLGVAVAGVLLAGAAVAGDRDDRDDHKKVDHVLLISVDGMHQSDLAWYVQNHPQSTLAKLTAQGVDYSNASTPFPSDSFPGMVGQVASFSSSGSQLQRCARCFTAVEINSSFYRPHRRATYALALKAALSEIHL